MLRAIPQVLLVPIILVVLLTLGVVWVSENNYRSFQQGMSQLVEERTRIDLVNDMALVLLNAETAQRGYLLTGRDEYLRPLDYAKEQLPKLENRLAASLGSRPDRWQDLDRVRQSLMKKLVELETSIQMYKFGEREKALEMAGSEEGRALMDAARATITNLSQHMNAELEANREAWLRGIEFSRYSILGVGLLTLLLLVTVFQLLGRDMQNKARITQLTDSENARLGREVAERTHELNELTNYLQWTAEREKAAIARDLHDELGGILTSAKMDIEWIGSRTDRTPEMEKRLTQLNRLLDEAVSLKRRVIEDLRPSLLDNLGLAPALEWHVTEHCKSAGLICKLDIADLADVIDSDTSIAVYRIVQEALTNVIRHAKATRFELSLRAGDDSDDIVGATDGAGASGAVTGAADHGRSGGEIELRMRDNGVGLPASFNAAKLSHGLSGMRQRARALGGDIAWESAARQGTRIDVRIPVRKASRDALDEDSMPPMPPIPGAALAAKTVQLRHDRQAAAAQPTDPSSSRPPT